MTSENVLCVKYLLVYSIKSIFQLPIGILIDKVSGEKIDFFLAIGGSFLMNVAVFLYIFARLPIHIYLIQALMGVAGAV